MPTRGFEIEGDELLTSKELTERYKGRVTERTLANWRSTRQGPPFCKVGGRVLYPLSEVVKWEKQRTMNAARD